MSTINKSQVKELAKVLAALRSDNIAEAGVLRSDKKKLKRLAEELIKGIEASDDVRIYTAIADLSAMLLKYKVIR